MLILPAKTKNMKSISQRCFFHALRRNYDDRNKKSLTFGETLEALKAGKKVARKGWNGKGMFLCFVHWKDWSVNPAETHKTSTHLAPWIGMNTADNMFVPWLASQTDML